MSITYTVYKAEANISEQEIIRRAKMLDVTAYDINNAHTHWTATCDRLVDAEKLDAYDPHRLVSVPESVLRTIVDYADASSNPRGFPL